MHIRAIVTVMCLGLLTVSAPASAAAQTNGAPVENCLHQATVTHPVIPIYPDSLRSKKLGAKTVLVKIALDARGKVVDSSIEASSGYPAIDTAALDAARASTYAPAVLNCKAVAGVYLFRAQFFPGAPATPDPCNHAAAVMHLTEPPNVHATRSPSRFR